LRVAIVHDWLVTWRGGEKVLEAIASLYPDAPIFTLFCDSQVLPESLKHRKVITHPVANPLRFMRKALLPLMPIWIESFDLSGFDLIISTSSCVAKGVIPDPGARHLCYMHSPMRYVWDQRQEYLGGMLRLPILGFFVQCLSAFLRMWDTTSSTRVDLFIANSNFVKQRIRKFYGRGAIVIPPPVDIERFKSPKDVRKKGYLLAAGAFVGYKRFDLAIAACEKLGRKLVIAGQGPDLDRLRALSGPNTSIIDAPDDVTWARLMVEADGFLFPGVEDFGITAIEAMAAGTPVIARRCGGALDFILENKTGLFFDEPTTDSLCEAIERHGRLVWDRDVLEEHASKYGRDGFLAKLRVTIEELTEPEIS
jgi:glycosyltransferase involved in cell wall biosynthesis